MIPCSVATDLEPSALKGIPCLKITEIECQPEVKRKTEKILNPSNGSLPPSCSPVVVSLSRPSKVVSFSTAEIREYAITPGECPTCKDTLSITLDWNYNPQSKTIQVEDVGRIPKYQRPYKLTYAERTRRLVEVTGLSAAALVKTTLTQRVKSAKQCGTNKKNERLDAWLDRRLVEEIAIVESFCDA